MDSFNPFADDVEKDEGLAKVWWGGEALLASSESVLTNREVPWRRKDMLILYFVNKLRDEVDGDGGEWCWLLTEINCDRLEL